LQLRGITSGNCVEATSIGGLVASANQSPRICEDSLKFFKNVSIIARANPDIALAGEVREAAVQRPARHRRRDAGNSSYSSAVPLGSRTG